MLAAMSTVPPGQRDGPALPPQGALVMPPSTPMWSKSRPMIRSWAKAMGWTRSAMSVRCRHDHRTRSGAARR